MSKEELIRDIFNSQYQASLNMFKLTIRSCTDEAWDSPVFTNRFWHIAYHALFYERLYLFEGVSKHIPWVRHHENAENLSCVVNVYLQEDILDFVDICREHTIVQLKSMNLDDQPGFPWLPFSPIERLAYNLRHFQHHLGQLTDRIRQSSGEGVAWITSEK